MVKRRTRAVGFLVCNVIAGCAAGTSARGAHSVGGSGSDADVPAGFRAVSSSGWRAAVPQAWESVRVNELDGARSATGAFVLFTTVPREYGADFARAVGALRAGYLQGASGAHAEQPREVQGGPIRAMRFDAEIPGATAFLERHWWFVARGNQVAVVMCGGQVPTAGQSIPAVCNSVFATLQFGNGRARANNGQQVLGTDAHSLLVPADWTGEDVTDGPVHMRVMSSPGPAANRTFVFTLARPLEQRTLRDDMRTTYERMRSQGATGEATALRAGPNDGWVIHTSAAQPTAPNVRQRVVVTDQPLGYGMAVCMWTEANAAELPECERAAATLRVTAAPPTPAPATP